MAETSGRNRQFTVGDWLVEPELDRITRESGSAYLRSQVMEVLVYLARNQGLVVSLDDLLDDLWAGKVVTDGAVYNCIAELRNALCAGGDSDSFIETIPKKGYRLVAPVSGLDPEHGIPDKEPRSKRYLAAVFALVVVASIVAWPVVINLNWASLLQRAPHKSIAVLPFEDLSPSGDQRYFADGMAEELLNILVQLEGLNVTGRTSSFSFRGSNWDLKSIGEQLDVTYVLDGSVRKNGDELRITARLNNARTGYHLWSKSYDRQFDDILSIQEDIARSVAGALSVALDIEGRNHLPGTGTDNVDAYDFFLRALNADSFDEAKVFYERAIQLDPHYAEAYAGFGAEYGARLSWELPPKDARAAQERGHELVVFATKLDPELPIAYRMLSQYAWARGDWIEATELHRKYSELAPADIGARLGNHNTLGRAGRTAESITVGEVAVLADPLSINGLLVLGEHYIQAERYEDADTVLAKADRINRGPTQGAAIRRMFMAISQGEREVIREALRNYAAIDPRVHSVVNAILDQFDADSDIVLDVMRRTYENDAEITSEGRMIIASMAAYYGDADFALEIMSKELEVNLLRVGRLWYPFFSDMRRLPGFKSLAEHVGFVPYWRTYGWADTCKSLGDEDFECR